MERRAARERLLPAPFLPFGRRAGFRPEKLGAAAAWTPACLHRNQRRIVSLRPTPGCRRASSLLNQMRSTQIK